MGGPSKHGEARLIAAAGQTDFGEEHERETLGLASYQNGGGKACCIRGRTVFLGVGSYTFARRYHVSVLLKLGAGNRTGPTYLQQKDQLTFA